MTDKNTDINQALEGSADVPCSAEPLHPYHCVRCGNRLRELRLGILCCPQCKTQYLPTRDDDANTLSVAWIQPKPREREWGIPSLPNDKLTDSRL